MSSKGTLCYAAEWFIGHHCLQGNNEECISALDKEGYVTFEQALWCVRCPQLHPSLASKYVELIKGELLTSTLLHVHVLTPCSLRPLQLEVIFILCLLHMQ